MNEHSSAQLFLALFRFLEEHGIAYCVMGDSRDFPHVIASDVDIVIAPDCLPSLAGRLQTFCARHEWRVVQCLSHEHNAHYFVLSRIDVDGGPIYLAVDFCGDYYRHGRLFLTAQQLLSERTAARDRVGRARGFFVAAPADEFIYYLMKRVDKQQLDECHASHLSAQWRQDSQGARCQLKYFWDSATDVAELACAAESGDWSALSVSLPRLRKALQRQLRQSARATFAEFKRRWARLAQPTGLLLVVLGPDGSGKSSLIQQLSSVLQPAFRRVEIFHLRPRLFQRAAAAIPVTQPQAQPPHAWLVSLIKPIYFLADYGLGYLLKIRPRLVRSGLVVFDRYYHDLLVDPRRYRYRASMRWPRSIGRQIPSPDLWLVLDVPAEVAQARKSEVTFAESARQRAAYRDLAARLDNAVLLNAARPLAEVVTQASSAVLAHLAERTRMRLNASAVSADNPLGARVLLFFCRHEIPFFSRLVRVLFNSDIYATLAPSTRLPHPYGIIIHSKARLGERVTVMQQVTLGGKDMDENLAPIVGDDVYIGVGAKVLGGVRIGNEVTIGANAVVTRDVPPCHTVVGFNRLLPREAAATILSAMVRDTKLEIWP
ncbi:MAG: thymidylate kinase-like protein [Gammaproteobacteria bacterium]|nr:thymidylate kinase-like protein [Gammaproteobacteria bacterium]